jgi:threonine aldolase
MRHLHTFASDNVAGAHPRIIQALERANADMAVPYGGDPWTEQADAQFRRLFGNDMEIFYVFLGTAANVTALRSMTRPWHSVLCSEVAHIYTDECGAPEMHTGCKIVPVSTTAHGKITPEALLPQLVNLGNEHHNQPRILSITQSTELGTVYTPEEIKELTMVAHENGMLVHMDGARIANATAALGCDVASFTRDAGIDALCFGGTKNGMLYGEAVIFFNRALAKEFAYIRKQSMQLTSKMRFLAAQFVEMLKDGLWLECAASANRLAIRLEQGIRSLSNVEIVHPVEVNAVFVKFKKQHAARLLEDCFFHFNATSNEARLMTSFAHTPEQIDAFIAYIAGVTAH